MVVSGGGFIFDAGGFILGGGGGWWWWVVVGLFWVVVSIFWGVVGRGRSWWLVAWLIIIHTKHTPMQILMASFADLILNCCFY